MGGRIVRPSMKARVACMENNMGSAWKEGKKGSSREAKVGVSRSV